MPPHLRRVLIIESKYLLSKKLKHELEGYIYKIIKGCYKIIIPLNVSFQLEIQVSKSQIGKTRILKVQLKMRNVN